ncbi:LytR C-terminal domain-containing protein [Cellulomonas sp. zg-ZUI222]|uniref:LytR C-terminal domain-containing protein n=1 Tax=Cellulomonas wangleii TaxID=2816956 RepID=A0ABX8D6D1_9CELL|nr:MULTISPECIES: LytR C-terminal domain-containing protein [Cellulomonas]MBO0901294.1 LytR C-terminal domain-containing protein [Cellulomonas sp. zg-ZUI22]MBO0921740.1 LytR C-terminal domain-containing protein [Cellulomonas wangleii]MBO0924838.1 LytR C-terminal domain-containing protein [Cellulomonas wangleii]QVI63006.1 LytR C-terminal domain-containing protein [Cellulomonas wangleii]
MSKADYPYPEDEFDAISPDAPTGVHRAPRSAWSRWWPFLVVLLVVPVLAYGAVEYLSRTGDLPQSGGGTSQEQPEVPAEEDATGGEGDGTEAPEGEAEAPVPEATTPAPEPVLTTPVAVLNGARVSGLAGRVADELTAAGFTDVTPDNATTALPAESTVYVASEDLRPTADLVAATTGVPTVEVAPDRADGGIVVLLVTDPDA